MKNFFAQLGGPKAVAEALTEMSGEPLKINAVYQWPYEGTIPHRWRPFVIRLAQEKGVELPDELKSLAGITSGAPPDPKPLRGASAA